MFKYFRSARRRSQISPVYNIQQLELKQLLTEMAEVSMTKHGDIKVTGDKYDNDVTVEINGNIATVTGNNGTSLRWGNNTVAAGQSVDVQLPNYIRDLDVKMKGGNDTVEVIINSNIRIDRDIDVDTGHGDDTVYVAVNSIYTGRELEIFTRAGDDRVVMEDVNAYEIDVEPGTGNDRLVIGQRVAARRLAEFDGGPGHDNIVRQSTLSGAKIKRFEGNSVNANSILNSIFDRLADTGLF